MAEGAVGDIGNRTGDRAEVGKAGGDPEGGGHQQCMLLHADFKIQPH